MQDKENQAYLICKEDNTNNKLKRKSFWVMLLLTMFFVGTVSISHSGNGTISGVESVEYITKLNKLKTAAQLKFSEYLLNKNVAKGYHKIGDWIKDSLIISGVLKQEDIEKYTFTNDGDVALVYNHNKN